MTITSIGTMKHFSALPSGAQNVLVHDQSPRPVHLQKPVQHPVQHPLST